MIILPAIDLYEKKCVRLLKGNYNDMVVYSEHPEQIAEDFSRSGATNIHIVDLEGAKSGTTPNIDVVKSIIKSTDLKAEIGGGIRSLKVIDSYVNAGASRVILGTAATENLDFVKDAVKNYGEKIAVSIDIRDGFVAIKGWTEKSKYTYDDFCLLMQDAGVSTMICTDISKDGAMQGTNVSLYKELSEKFDMNIIASGGVTSIEDIKKLSSLNIYGAIIGKAYYTGAIKIDEAVSLAEKGVAL